MPHEAIEQQARLCGAIARQLGGVLAQMRAHAREGLSLVDVGAAGAAELEEVVALGERAQEIVDQLLAIAGKQLLVRKRVALVPWLSTTQSALAHELPHGVNLTLETSADALAEVEIDVQAIRSVLAELLGNAVLAGAKQILLELGVVELDARLAGELDLAPGAYCRLAVRDTGCGVPPSILPRVLQPFVSTRERLGLGLAVAMGTLRQHGGGLELASVVGAGTTVSLYLPRAGRVGRAAHATGEQHPRGSERVLVVDDETLSRHAAVRLLRSLGYEVLQAGSAREALETLAGLDRPVDLLISDVVMPETNGFELARQIASRQPSLRTLFTSGYAAEMLEGAPPDARLIQKPYTHGELARAVRQALDP
ncbi:MAG: response regulator [Deltaproteobacteria bacterium]|nr:response regulator [Deltaproteobacteria bacterium]